MSAKTQYKKGALSWTLYDWANSAFATTIVAGFFPAFFKDYWSAGVDVTTSTARLGFTISAASLIVAALAPILGSLADRGSRKKLLLTILAIVGILFTGALCFVPRGSWPMAVTFYVIAYVGWLGSIVIYDSLIVSVSDENTVDKLSGLGFAVGYLGGGILFLVNVLMFQFPALFSLIDPALADIAGKIQGQEIGYDAVRTAVLALDGAAHETLRAAFDTQALSERALLGMVASKLGDAQVLAVQISFFSVAVWWAIFSIPLLLNVKEPGGREKLSLLEAARGGFTQLIQTVHEIRKLKVVGLFLLAYWLYIDGVDTIIVMAVDYGKSIGFSTGELISALLMVQFVAFPFAFLFGWLGQKFGTKKFILVGLVVYVFVTIFGANLDTEPFNIFGLRVSKFYSLAFMIGTVQGGVQALSRSMFTKLIPEDKAGEFFGFYNMVGKFAAIIGPTLMGTVAVVTGNPRVGILSIAILILVGAVLLLFVDEKKGHEIARGLRDPD